MNGSLQLKELLAQLRIIHHVSNGQPAISVQRVQRLRQLPHVGGVRVQGRELNFRRDRLYFSQPRQFSGLVFGQVWAHRVDAQDGREVGDRRRQVRRLREGVGDDGAEPTRFARGLNQLV